MIKAIIIGFIGFVLIIALMPSAQTTTPEKKGATAATNAATAKANAQWASDVAMIRAMRSALHNPDSLKLEEVLRMADGSLCLTYRATNAFGALVRQQAVIAPKAKAAASSGDDELAALWNRYCGGKSGADITSIRWAL